MVDFNFTYDPGVTLEQRLGFEMAAAIWSTFLTDDVTVNLHITGVDTLDNGQAVGGAIPIFHEQNYGITQEYIVQDNTSTEDQQANQTLQDGNTVDVLINGEIVDGNTTINLTSAQAKALGMDEALVLDNGNTWDRNLVDANALDGYILINNSYDWSYDFTRESQAAKGTLDFLTMALHEIGHAIGFVSGLDGLLETTQLHSGETQTEGFTLLDMFRQTLDSQKIDNPDGEVADLSIGANAHFSIDGTNSLGTFSSGRNKKKGGDGYQASHWKRFRQAVGIMDPTLGYQERTNITHLDLQAFDVLGWDIDYAALSQGLDLQALHQEALAAISADFGVGTQDVENTLANGQDWYTMGYGSWWQAFKTQMLDMGYGSWWQQFETKLLNMGYGSWWQAFEQQMLDMGYGSWWQSFEEQVLSMGYGSWWQQFETDMLAADSLNMGYGSWWQQFEPQMLEMTYGSWWQVFEQQMLTMGYGSWWQEFEAKLLNMGYGSWWQAFESDVLEMGYGSWWQIFEDQVLEMGYGSWWQTFEGNLLEMGYGSWWQFFEMGYGSWWQQLETFFARIDELESEGTAENTQIADGGVGGEETEIFYGSENDDIIAGDQKQDRIKAGDGDDLIDGKEGHDVLWGEAGRDLIYGHDGNDLIYGGDDDDLLMGEAGEDHLKGEAGHDILRGGDDNDILEGGAGRDDLQGDAGRDVVDGGEGNDRLAGGADHDAVIGGEGRDQVHGGSGNDLLYGDGYLGKETLQQLRTLLKQQSSDTGTSSETGTSTPGDNNPIRIEIEDMALSGDDYVIGEYYGHYYDFLSVRSGSVTGTTTFTGPSGEYLVVTRYRDSGRGEEYGQLSFELNGNLVDQFFLDQETGNRYTRTISQSLTVNTGDTISFEAIKGNSGEYFDLDYIEFVSLDNLIVTELDPVSSQNPPVGETSQYDSSNTTIRVEAESMTLVGDYSSATHGFASGEQLIELAEFNQGKALTAFEGETGFYDVVVGYHDLLTFMGTSAQIDAVLNGVEVDSWQLTALAESDIPSGMSAQEEEEFWSQLVEQYDPHAGIQSNDTFTMHTVASGIALSTNDVFELIGTSGDGEIGQRVYIDYVDFIKVDAPVLESQGTSSSPTGTTPTETTPTETRLVAHWSFDDASGLTATSKTGNHNATLKNTVTNDSQWTTGEIGGALKLDGVNDYVAIANSNEINTATHGQRTISLWFKADDINRSEGKQVLYEEGGGTRGLNIYLHNGQLYVGGWNNDAKQSGWTGTYLHTEAIVSDQWHHVALVLDGNEQVQNGALKAYLDGEIFSEGLGSQLWSRGGNIALGAVNGGTRFHDGTVSGTGKHAFAGSLDEAYLYNRALTEAEIGTLVGKNNDVIQGGVGNDIAFGGDGNDIIYGESQQDDSSQVLTGIQSYNGHTYLLSTASSWTNTQAEAERLGGNLVTINNVEENAWLRNTFGTHVDYWIGFSDADTEGQWTWTSGETITYTNWAPGQPDDYEGNQDYATLNGLDDPGSQDPLWDDTPGTGSYAGIIELNEAYNDTLFGDTGNDTVYGQAGNDALYGDTLNASLSEGLVAHWSFEEGFGSSTADTAGQTNDTAFRWGGATWVEDAQRGSAVQFDGVNGGVSASDSLELNMTHQLTLSTWVKADQFRNWDGLITKGVTDAPYSLMLMANGAVRFESNWGGDKGIWDSETTLSTGQWHHVTVTYDGEALRFYIDGQLDSNVVYTSIDFDPNNEDLVIGAQLPGGDEYFDGTLDDVRVYNRAISAAEVANLATSDQKSGSALNVAEDAIYHNGSHYLLTSDNLTWEEAQAQAQSVGGNLVTINDTMEETWLQATFGTAQSMWIGLTDKFVEGQWEWISGEAVTYVNWAPGEPNDFGTGEDYAVINKQSTNNLWDDRGQAGQLYRGIIEIKGTESDNLVGGVGNDTLLGGLGNDTLNGTDAVAAGNFEKDTLLGGSGADTFILGDATQAYYQSQGDQDYALIKDFLEGEDILQLYGSVGAYTQSTVGQDLYLYYQDAGSDLVAILENTATTLNLSTVAVFV